MIEFVKDDKLVKKFNSIIRDCEKESKQQMINQAQLNALRLEADELNRRIFDLQKFAHSSKWKTLKGIEKDLLREQLRYMCGYANNLGARITYYERRMEECSES